MQTFLPIIVLTLEDFDRNARVLDSQRLNKQRVECKQIVKAHTVPGYGWQHHPAVKMWRGYDWALLQYAMAIHRECERRSIRDKVDIAGWFLLHLAQLDDPTPGMPPWMGDERLHRSHQSNLKRKSPILYRQFDVPVDLPYYWPV